LKLLLKQGINYLALLIVCPLIAISKLGVMAGSERMYMWCAQALCEVTGFPGVVFRRAFYRFMLDDCDWDVVIEFGSFFTHPRGTLAKGVCIGAYCLLGYCELGQGTQIASRVSILSGKHQHGIQALDSGVFEVVRVGKECWLGEASVIMANIGDRTTIGAGSVVVKAIPGSVVAAGNPARIVRELSGSASSQEDRS